MNRPFLIAALAVIFALGGALAYRQFAGRAVQVPRGDPALATVASIRFLERSEHPLTPEQIKTILPLIKVLRDTDPNDVEASRSLTEQIRIVFTPAQRAELEQAREEALQRRSGEGRRSRRLGPPGEGQRTTRQRGPQGFTRAEFRQRALARLIQQLESRL